jgi:hypothetical protein
LTLPAIPIEAIMVLIIIVVGFIIFLLLPALLELRKPKDAGPRKMPQTGKSEAEN